MKSAASKKLLLAAGVALLASACQDSAPNPLLAPEAPLQSAQSGNRGAKGSLSAASPYACFTSVATPGGPQAYRYHTQELSFPGAAQARGATLRYRYRAYSPEGELLWLANCVIPRSLAALDLMHERFGVPPHLRRPTGRDHDSNELSTQSCVENGVCEIDPINVVAPPRENQPDDPPGTGCTIHGCDGPGPGWGDDGGGGGGSLGGGDDPCESCWPGEDDRSGEYDGTGELIDCSASNPSSSTRCEQMDASIKWLLNFSDQKFSNKDQELCRQLGRNAYKRHYERRDPFFDRPGAYFFWTNPPNERYYGGAIPESTGEVGLTKLVFDEPHELANTIAHEESHFPPYNYHDRNTGKRHPEDGRYAEDIGNMCGRGFSV